jgi:hypothetical protein
MGVPKLGLLLSQKIGHSYFFQIKPFLEHVKATSYNLQKDFSNRVSHTPIRNHLTPALRGFVVGSQILNLTPDLSFDHNSCISSLNEQCKGTFGIYTLRPFQWYLEGPIWCFFSFLIKVLNIRDSHTNATPKMRVHLGIIRLHLLHFPPFVRVCFTHKHIFLAS